jgi:hypothetical protein
MTKNFPEIVISEGTVVKHRRKHYETSSQARIPERDSLAIFKKDRK